MIKINNNCKIIIYLLFMYDNNSSIVVFIYTANIRAESVSSAKHLAKLNGILCFVPTLSFKQVPGK